MANGAQVIDITQELMFAEGNVVKYVSRAGRKGGESRLDDLCKAKYYLDLAIRRAEAGKCTTSSLSYLQCVMCCRGVSTLGRAITRMQSYGLPMP